MIVNYIDAHRDRFGVEPICTVLQVAPSTYYAVKSRQPSARAVRDATMIPILVALWAANYRVYGAHKLWKAARRAGHGIGRDQVARLMRAAGIEGVHRLKRVRTTRADDTAARHPDLVRRDFTAAAPNELWVTDITYVATWAGVAYVCFIVDAFSRMIVGWQLATHMRTELVMDALEMANGLRRPEGGLIAHSDRGSQYTSLAYTDRLDELGAAPSVGSRGNAYDNAMAEAWVATFKTELVNGRRFPSYEHAEHETLHWIGFYNEQRLHEELGDLPPAEYEELNIKTDNSQTLAAR